MVLSLSTQNLHIRGCFGITPSCFHNLILHPHHPTPPFALKGLTYFAGIFDGTQLLGSLGGVGKFSPSFFLGGGRGEGEQKAADVYKEISITPPKILKICSIFTHDTIKWPRPNPLHRADIILEHSSYLYIWIYFLFCIMCIFFKTRIFENVVYVFHLDTEQKYILHATKSKKQAFLLLE